jgi:acetyl-CoA C-acetyltransferase
MHLASGARPAADPRLTPVIVSAVRTPIARAYKGALTDVRADELAALAARAALERCEGLAPADIDDVICGAAWHTGEQNFNLGRIVAQLAGLPASVPGTTVNRFCSSSLQAIRMAQHAIAAGEGHAYLVVGVESISRCAGLAWESEHANERFTRPERPDFISDLYIGMGQTAENVAERWQITRERMDELALASHRRALAARDAGVFDREIVPVPLPDGSAFTADEGPRPTTSAEQLAALEPAFREGGTVTAGNACPLSDGAAAVIVTSERYAADHGLTPLVRILGSSVTGVEPEIMGVGPIDAVNRLLDRAGMTIADVDVVELNEAFAAQVLAVCDAVGIDVESQLNPHGGGIALGHPFGMTGARIMTTLINDLQTLDRTYGIETMCVGGGQGMAMLVERVS